MKLKDLFEFASAGVTSVSNVGSMEYQAFGDALIKLYKRNPVNVPVHVASIKRKKGQGWSMCPNENWTKCGLEHFGNLHNIKTPVNGTKTISSNLKAMLKAWGVRYEDIFPKKD